MAKRFTETNKWKDDWYLSLSNDHRIIWQYILDNCSIAGIWQRGFKSMNYFCNTTITDQEFFRVFGGRVLEISPGGNIFIPKFLKVQYPKGLTSNKPLILSVLREIEQFNLYQMIVESLGNHYPMIKVKGKGNKKQVKGEGKKETGKGEGGEKFEIVYPFNTNRFKDAWDFWKQYKQSQHHFTYKGGQTEQIALKDLAEKSTNNEETAIQIIQQSVTNGWKGLFHLKIVTNGQHKFGAKVNLDELNQTSDKFLRESGLGGTRG